MAGQHLPRKARCELACADFARYGVPRQRSHRHRWSRSTSDRQTAHCLLRATRRALGLGKSSVRSRAVSAQHLPCVPGCGLTFALSGSAEAGAASCSASAPMQGWAACARKGHGVGHACWEGRMADVRPRGPHWRCRHELDASLLRSRAQAQKAAVQAENEARRRAQRVATLEAAPRASGDPQGQTQTASSTG